MNETISIDPTQKDFSTYQDSANQNQGRKTSADRAFYLKKVLIVFSLLFIFLVGVKGLSTSLGLLGGGLADGLLTLSKAPILALLTGMLTTVLIQSSSATSSIIVGLVSSGTVSMAAAIPMIMGANLGTSVTNSLVSIGYIKDRAHFQKAFAAATIHDIFNILAVIVLLPLEMATGFLEKLAMASANAIYGTSAGFSFSSPIKAAVKPLVSGLEWISFQAGPVFGAAIMLILSAIIIVSALSLIVKTTRKIVARKETVILDKLLGHNQYLSIVFGILLTFFVQSSSITTSLLVPLAGSGVLSLMSVFPITVGANIGTTATALIAALAGNVLGLAIALVHFFFNISGTLILYVPAPSRRFCLYLAEKLADTSSRKRLVGIGYIVGFFFLFPLGLTFLF